jgi:hypothetical protein
MPSSSARSRQGSDRQGPRPDGEIVPSKSVADLAKQLKARKATCWSSATEQRARRHQGLGVTTPVTIGDDDFDNLFWLHRGHRRFDCTTAESCRTESCAIMARMFSPASRRSGIVTAVLVGILAAIGPRGTLAERATSLTRELAVIWDAEHVSPLLRARRPQRSRPAVDIASDTGSVAMEKVGSR